MHLRVVVEKHRSLHLLLLHLFVPRQHNQRVVFVEPAACSMAALVWPGKDDLNLVVKLCLILGLCLVLGRDCKLVSDLAVAVLLVIIVEIAVVVN